MVHIGRRSKRVHETPVNLFRTRGDYVIALTYGREAEWVKNACRRGL